MYPPIPPENRKRAAALARSMCDMAEEEWPEYLRLRAAARVPERSGLRHADAEVDRAEAPSSVPAEA